MHILITNDDGIESKFLHALAEALARHFRISIAAPKSEQSWIGRAVSRRRTVSVEKHTELPWEAWSIDGTPTDCVNIALSNLLPESPDAVVSGINIGYNTTTQLIYSSGTVAGALEGAFWGLPAFAVSQQIPDQIFAEVSQNNGHLPPDWQPLLSSSARHAAEWISGALKEPRPTEDALVHNLNYPSQPNRPMELVRTVPAPLNKLPFFKKDGNGGCVFHFQHGESLPSDQKTDRQALSAGQISHSILNFSSIGRDLNH